ncbi:MAG: hypothetical protein GPJ54_20870, partial [Candidatus Heimdallarchaeota archaeon]|nr:hypothetical protein [Candidatus Heimdallarchaeota archaeon]
MHISKPLLLLIVLISSILAVSGVFYQLKQDEIETSAYTLVSPIYIDGNFSSTATLMGWVGDGSSTSPYIIENIEIQGTEFDTLITIANTVDYFIIRNSFIHGGDRGIFLDNADRGSITSNVVSNNTSHGIVLASASRVNITDNQISYNGNGVFSFFPFLILVSGNEIHHNTLVGVDLEQSSNNTVSNNDVHHNPIGILMQFQSQSLTQSSYVLHNNVHDNSEQGIYLDRSKIVQVYNNTVYRNGDGIRNNAGEDNHIYENVIEDNKYGIYIIGGLQDTNNIHDN